MDLTPELQAGINAYIDEHREEMLALWAKFVNTLSHTGNKEQTGNMARVLCAELEALGCKCTIYDDMGPTNGPAVEGILGAERPGLPVAFAGHFDTVALKGDYPFRVDEEGRAHGLGCLDMKGGIVVAIWTVKALNAFGWAERPIRFFFVSDEESGHKGGKTPDFLQEHAKGNLCAFNMETGLPGNQICIGRKGVGQLKATVHGIAAHSGACFADGRSAITEMAHKILEIESLTDLEKQTTLAVTMMSGGTVINSIPPIAECTVDVRYARMDERNRVVEALKEICAKTTVDGTTVEAVYTEMMPPYDTTDSVRALAAFVANVSEKCGYGKMDTVALGGGSDASYITMAGTPVICAMGVRGEFNHSDREYAVVESLYERTKLMVAVMFNISELAF